MPSLDEYLLDIYYTYLKILQGKERISLLDIKVYADLYGEQFDDWVIDAFLGLDTARLEAWQTKSQP
tara:strand:+ start:294 stop:494 length:201 start_codon:yes stop_codon:yes gene_type:complete